MKVRCNGIVHECDKAVKGLDFVKIYRKGKEIASYEGISDFSIYQILDGGSWTALHGYEKDLTEDTLNLPVTTGSQSKKVIYSIKMKDLDKNDKVFLSAQFEITNDKAYNVGVGLQLIRAASPTSVDGQFISPLRPVMENITPAMHHKVFHLSTIDVEHGGGDVYYNVIAWCVSDSSKTGDTVAVEQGYGGLVGMII